MISYIYRMGKLIDSLIFGALVVIYYTVRFYYILNPGRTVLSFRAWMDYEPELYQRGEVGIISDNAAKGKPNELVISYSLKAFWLWAQAVVCIVACLFIPAWIAILSTIAVSEIILFIAKKVKK